MKLTDHTPAEISENPAYRNILTRTSVRRYTQEGLTDAQLTAILRAAMSAPSGVNKQPWEFIVIDDPAMLSTLGSALPYAKMAAHAPAAIVVCANKERIIPTDDNLWEQDCSAASENILLAAHALGLGAVWTCLYPHQDRMAAAQEILNLPDTLIPFNLIPIGHPEAPHVPLDKWHPEKIHFNRLP